MDQIIDMVRVGNIIARQPVICSTEPAMVNADTKLFRYASTRKPDHFDHLHVLVDGDGSYKAILYPDLLPAQTITKGHLTDFLVRKAA